MPTPPAVHRGECREGKCKERTDGGCREVNGLHMCVQGSVIHV